MKKIVLLSILFLSVTSLAQQASTTAKPAAPKYMLETFPDSPEVHSFDLRNLLEGSNLAIRWQIEGDTSGQTTDNRIILRPRINLTIPLSQKMRLRMQSQTGSSYSSGWDRLVTFDGSDSNLLQTFAVRRLFFEYDLNKDAKVQIGALESGSEWFDTRPFSFDTDGWIDGLRVAFRNVYKNIDQIHITVGQLDPTASRSAFKRNFDPSQADFIQIKISGEALPKLNYLLEVARLDSVNETFARLDLDLDVEDWTNNILDKVRSEFVFDAQTGAVTGFTVGAAKRVGPIRAEAGLIRQERSETQRRLNNGLFREEGDSVYATFQYRFKDSGWRLSQRCRVCVDESTCTAKYRCDTTVDTDF
jgi:hypothetical protein